MKARSFASFVGALAGACASLFAGAAGAHSILVNPPPIGPDDSAKSGPCGCYFGAAPQDPADDPSPSACPGDYSVTTLQAGTALKIEWKETINHDGAFRVAFSAKAPEATTKADMDANVMTEITDENPTSGATLNTTITVPSEPCDLCTIQLRQFMMGAAQPYYYSCAAVKIVADPGTGGAGGSTGAGASGPGSGGASNGGGGSGAMGQGGTFSAGAGKSDPPPAVAASCSIHRASTDDDGSSRAPAILIGALAIASILARKRAPRARKILARRRSG